MIEKIKYHLLRFITSRQMRMGGIAVLTAATVAVITLLGSSVKTISVSDGDRMFTVHSLDINVTRVMESLPLKSEHYQILKTSVKNNCTMVEIAYFFPVFITNGNDTAEVEFTGGTVRDVLYLAGFLPDEHDFVEPALDTVIKETVYVDYTDIDFVTGSYTEEIPYQTETVYSSAMAEGTSKISDGAVGTKEVLYTQKLVNGVCTETTVTSTKVLKEAVNAVKTVGTKKTTVAAKAKSKTVTTSASVNGISTLSPSSPIELDEKGVPVHYASKMTARATAYTYTGHNCSTGVAPQPGYIAVNPRVIPYGTKMYIRTADGSFIYGYAVAADTGGFIRNYPTGVDLFMSTVSACNSFGVRNVEIYILN